MPSSIQSNFLNPLPSNHQSLFKLPIIFMLFMFLISVGISIYYYNQPTPYSESSNLFNFSNAIANQILSINISNFIIATIMFINKRMHQLTKTTLLIIVVACIIYQLFSLGLGLANRKLLQYLLLEQYSRSNLSILISILSIVYIILKPIVLIVIIALVGQLGKVERPTYHLTFGHNRLLFALLFTLIFLLPCIAIVSPILNVTSRDIIRLYSHVENIPNVTASLFGILPSLMVFMFVVISFLIIFFSVKNCFKREFDSISLKILFKSVVCSYLYLFIFSVILSFFCLVITVNINNYNTLVMWLSLMIYSIIIINPIAIILLTRKAAKKYFS